MNRSRDKGQEQGGKRPDLWNVTILDGNKKKEQEKEKEKEKEQKQMHEQKKEQKATH